MNLVAAPRRRLGLRDLVAYGSLALIVGGWWSFVRPATMGGPLGYIVVHGVSMQPRYHTGDLVLTRRAHGYRRGDIVAYHVPRGQLGAGAIVIHRIIGGNAKDGFRTQGDNNPAPDDWRPRASDVIGHAWVLIPRGGNALATIRNPLPLASACAAGTIVFLMLGWRTARPVFTERELHALSRLIVHGGAHGTRAVAEIMRARLARSDLAGDEREHHRVERDPVRHEAVA